MTIPATPGIPDVIGRCDQLAQTQPVSSLRFGHKDAWIIAAQQALEDAADLIETLTIEHDAQRDRARTGEILIDHLNQHAQHTLQHLDDCEQDEHPYPNVIWTAGGCRACETLAITRHWLDQAVPLLTETELDTILNNPTN